MSASPLLRALAAGVLSISIGACRPSRPIANPTQPGARLTIGVALPLSGKLKAYGEGGRGAVRLAAGELDKTADRHLHFAVRDSKGDAAGAAQAVEELVGSDGAIAIVGPLFRSEAKAAAEKAQELGVPIIALTGDRQVTSAGAYVFRAGVAPEDEMDALVAYAMGELTLKSFAVLHPRIEYGERMLQLFKERVEERGGSIRKVESYEEDDTTFTAPIKRLVQRDAVAKRDDYRQAIAKCKDAPDNYRKARCEKEAREKVAPIIEFEGLFIPDGHRTIALIAPALASEDIIVEREPQALERIEKALGHQVKPVTLLGTSLWNSPELLKQGGRNIENAIFADAYFDAASDEATRTFVAGFRKHFGRRPELQDALLYDATRFIKTALAAEHPATTDDLRAALHQVRAFPGVTGDISFKAGTDAERTLKILTIKDQVIRPAKAAANSRT